MNFCSRHPNQLDQAPTIGPSKEILILGTFLGILQVADAVLTGVGVHHLGSRMEANPLIRLLIEELGYVPALALVKSFAIFVIIALCALSTRVAWIGRAMKVMIVIYMCSAIIPWTAVLLNHFS